MTALRFSLASLGLAAALVPSTAPAVDLGLGPYIEYQGGVTFMRNQNVTRANPPGLSGHVAAQEGFNVSGAVGTRFLEHFRIETNVGYRENKVTRIAIRPGENDGKGAYAMLTAMVNAYAEYDFEVGVIPYFGLGAGYGRVELDAENKSNTFQVDSDDHAFVWNVMGGVSVPFSEVTTFSLGYRYLATEDLNFRSEIRTAAPPAARTPLIIDSEYDAHELVFALRYSF